MNNPTRLSLATVFYGVVLLGLVLAFLMGCTPTSSPTPTAVPSPATATPFAWPSGFPAGFPTPALNGNIPTEVILPTSVPSVEDARPYFDYFSWQSFIALNWPAVANVRGVPQDPNNPAVFTSAPDGTAVVWSTYKTDYELFDQGSNRPTPWDSYTIADNPCANAQTGQHQLVRGQKDVSFVSDGNQAFSFPLVDQNSHYAAYEVLFNEQEYNFIRGQDEQQNTWLYLIANLAAAQPIQMPVSNPTTPGAMMLKVAWRIMTPTDDLSRYYVIDALVYDPATQTCQPQKVGLIGLHIVQKVDGFSQWIWTTFEQVDNVPGGSGGKAPYSFNNGTDNPATVGGFANRPQTQFPTPQPAVPTPVQVTRFNPIPTTPAGSSTVEMNGVYQQFLSGTVWQYYQLVFTQWPTDENSSVLTSDGGVYPQDAGQPFPVDGITNVVMETYVQSPEDGVGVGGNSCMSCHYRADESDFSWVLTLRAHD